MDEPAFNGHLATTNNNHRSSIFVPSTIIHWLRIDHALATEKIKTNFRVITKEARLKTIVTKL
jgi:hypothetical protein